MEQVIIDMIEIALRENYMEMFSSIKDLIIELAITYNAPSNWRDIGEMLAEKYKGNNQVYEMLELWNYENY